MPSPCLKTACPGPDRLKTKIEKAIKSEEADSQTLYDIMVKLKCSKSAQITSIVYCIHISYVIHIHNHRSMTKGRCFNSSINMYRVLQIANVQTVSNSIKMYADYKFINAMKIHGSCTESQLKDNKSDPCPAVHAQQGHSLPVPVGGQILDGKSVEYDDII